jgi:hypothetical protein
MNIDITEYECSLLIKRYTEDINYLECLIEVTLNKKNKILILGAEIKIPEEVVVVNQLSDKLKNLRVQKKEIQGRIEFLMTL